MWYLWALKLKKLKNRVGVSDIRLSLDVLREQKSKIFPVNKHGSLPVKTSAQSGLLGITREFWGGGGGALRL